MTGSSQAGEPLGEELFEEPRLEGYRPRVYTVSSLTRAIRSTLEADFDEVWVEGEVSNLRTPSSGHTYFTLKDAQSQIRAVLFRSQRRMVRFDPEDGLQVVARAHLSVYEARGEYQLIVETMEPKGLGALQLAFEQLRQKLAAEGLFDQARKRPIPMLPQRIGVVTSPTGAAIRDILQILKRRYANVHVLLAPVRVQGEGAAAEIAEAIDRLNEEEGIDVLIVGRGGGSLEDLWAFNEEAVARAIARSRIPVISAVGHEIDVTIADWVADLRAPTPSAAAELVVRSKAELVDQVRSFRRRLEAILVARLAQGRKDWEALVARRSLTDPLRPIAELGQRLDDYRGRLHRQGLLHRQRWADDLRRLLTSLRYVSPSHIIRTYRERRSYLVQRLSRGGKSMVVQKRERFAAVAARLDSLSPLATLGRGYAIAFKLPEKRIVRDAASLAAGDQLRVRLARGSARCRVEETAEEGEAERWHRS